MYRGETRHFALNIGTEEDIKSKRPVGAAEQLLRLDSCCRLLVVLFWPTVADRCKYATLWIRASWTTWPFSRADLLCSAMPCLASYPIAARPHCLLVIVNQTASDPGYCSQQLAMRGAFERQVSCLVRSQLCRLLLIAIGTEIGRRMLFRRHRPRER